MNDYEVKFTYPGVNGSWIVQAKNMSEASAKTIKKFELEQQSCFSFNICKIRVIDGDPGEQIIVPIKNLLINNKD